MAGRVPRGTKVLVVRAAGKIVLSHHLRGRRFDVRVPLPRRDVTVRVTATTLGGRQSSAAVSHVFGLPRSAQPRGSVPHLDPALARRIIPLVRAFPGASAVYVRDLTTGAGAAWNASAHFPAGSTLKLAIAVETLRSLRSTPARGSYADGLLRRAIVYSDNVAANLLEVLFGGSTSGGSLRVNSLMRGLGLDDSEMYGGYIPGTLVRRLPIPLRADEPPYYGVGKFTSAYDLAQLFAYIHLAAAGKGRLARRHTGFTAADARYLLYLLAHVVDRGKLGRFLGGRASALHKAGWITTARHDAGIVFWPGGAFTVAVMTHGAGVGTASDVLAGRVAALSLGRFARAAPTRTSSALVRLR